MKINHKRQISENWQNSDNQNWQFNYESHQGNNGYNELPRMHIVYNDLMFKFAHQIGKFSFVFFSLAIPVSI